MAASRLEKTNEQLEQMGYYAHRHVHREPSHHRGSCSPACRAGLAFHSHKIHFDVHGNPIRTHPMVDAPMKALDRLV